MACNLDAAFRLDEGAHVLTLADLQVSLERMLAQAPAGHALLVQGHSARSVLLGVMGWPCDGFS